MNISKYNVDGMSLIFLIINNVFQLLFINGRLMVVRLLDMFVLIGIVQVGKLKKCRVLGNTGIDLATGGHVITPDHVCA